jgi:hypothetical protein
VSTSRRLFVLLCLVAILWVTSHPAASGLAWTILAPFLFVVALIVALAQTPQPERVFAAVGAYLPVHSPRPPPQV